MKKICLAFAAFLLLSFNPLLAQTTTVETHYVTVRPIAPTYTKMVSTTTSDVWIGEDWTYNMETKKYNWNGGHWATPPKSKTKWKNGNWKKTEKGYTWVNGSWY